MIQENADPDVVLDLADFFEQLAPETIPLPAHDRGPTICRRISARR